MDAFKFGAMVCVVLGGLVAVLAMLLMVWDVLTYVVATKVALTALSLSGLALIASMAAEMLWP